MGFWPSETFEVETSRTQEDLVAGLKEKVEPMKKIRVNYPENGNLFQGTVSEDGFKVMHVNQLLNKMRITYIGEFDSGVNGTKVRVRARCSLFQLTLINCIFAVWLLMSISFITFSFTHPSVEGIGSMAFGILIILGLRKIGGIFSSIPTSLEWRKTSL